MAVFSGFYAVGTGFTAGVFQEVSGGSYARLAVNLTGSAAGGLTQNVGAFAAAAAPAGAMQRIEAIFDANSGGNLIAWWEIPNPVAVPTAFPATTLNIQLLSGVYADFNTGDVFPAGAMIGTVNGQPMVAGTILQLQGGNLQAQQQLAAKVVESPLFTVGGVNVGRFDSSGNLYVKGQLFANSTTIASSSTITI